MSGPLKIWFDHGLGDCVHFAHMLQLYRARGYEVQVHYEQNKRPLWEAAGIPYCQLSGSAYHKFAYHPSFNRPAPECDWSGNKIAGCFVPPLPPLPVEEAWEELCAVDLSGTLLEAATQDERDRVRRFVEHLEPPLILLHLQGTNWSGSKNVPHETQLQLYHLLLDATPGTLVLLDWDHRVPRLSHGRVRHLKADFGHANLAELGCLMACADLLIGVDSGPYHLASMTELPALGVFHHHYPSCVTLPRSRSAVMTRNADSYRPVNRARRARWSVLEYAGEYPSAADIARHALRMLEPRYLSRAHAGRDVMLQQWVRDWLRASTSLGPRADRDLTMDHVLRRLRTISHRHEPRVVETGCIRSLEDWSAGYSTYVLAAALDALGGSLVSVDVSGDNLRLAADLVQPWKRSVTCVQADSVEWLLRNQEPVSLLLLDSLDCEDPQHARHGLREIQAAHDRLGPDSLVVWDDTVWDGGWRGKGALGVPWLLERGWRIAASGYQVVMERRS